MALYRWIFFDLFDTLCTVDEPVYYEGKERAAKLLGVDPQRFLSEWSATSPEASVGRLKTPIDRAVRALDALGIKDRALAMEVAQLDVEVIQRCVVYYEGAVEALGTLRERGFMLGLISNATATTAFAVGPMRLRSHLDQLVFSYEVGLVKPDPAIFHTALRKAGCPPEEALFVGDGANGELDAAAALGMAALCMDHPVKALSFRNPAALSSPTHPRVSSFAELLALPALQNPLADA
jgi:putative hydrolase of the HAD superfamily